MDLTFLRSIIQAMLCLRSHDNIIYDTMYNNNDLFSLELKKDKTDVYAMLYDRRNKSECFISIETNYSSNDTHDNESEYVRYGDNDKIRFTISCTDSKSVSSNSMHYLKRKGIGKDKKNINEFMDCITSEEQYFQVSTVKDLSGLPYSLIEVINNNDKNLREILPDLSVLTITIDRDSVLSTDTEFMNKLTPKLWSMKSSLVQGYHND